MTGKRESGRDGFRVRTGAVEKQGDEWEYTKQENVAKIGGDTRK